MPGFLRAMPNVPWCRKEQTSTMRVICTRPWPLTLVQISVLLISRLLSEPAVRRAAVVVNVAQPLDDRRQKTLVNVSRREVRVAEIGVFIIVVQIELVRLCQLIIWTYNDNSAEGPRALQWSCDPPSLLPAEWGGGE